VIKKSSAQRGEAAAGQIPGWLTWLSWGIAILMMAFTTFLLVQRVTGVSAEAPAFTVEAPTPEVDPIPENSVETAPLPDYAPAIELNALKRVANPHTTIPDSIRREMSYYTVDSGDSVFSIAVNYDLKPETVLWANYDLLNDNPNMLSIGQDLTIPPTDGVFYKWKEGDTLRRPVRNGCGQITCFPIRDPSPRLSPHNIPRMSLRGGHPPGEATSNPQKWQRAVWRPTINILKPLRSVA